MTAMKDITPENLIRQGIHNYLKDVHTALPGIVEKFDTEQQLASVQPAIKRMLKTGRGEEEREIIVPRNLPLCINVPVVFPAGGGFHLTFPVKPGDECILMFCERSLDNWLDRGGVQEPSAKRFHALSDAFAIMGLHSKPKSISNYNNNAIELRTQGNKVSIENGLTTLTGATKIDGTLEVNGTTTVNGIGIINGGAMLNGGAAVSGGLTNNGRNVGANHQHRIQNIQLGNQQQISDPPI